MATYLQPVDPMSMPMFTYPDRNDQPPTEYNNMNDFFLGSQQPMDPMFNGFSEYPNGPDDFQFATSFDPLLHETSSKDLLSSYPPPQYQDKLPSPVSSHHSHGDAMPVLPSQQMWPDGGFQEMTGHLPQLDTQFQLPPGPPPPHSYGSAHSDSSNIGVDPSFIQQVPTPISSNHTPFSDIQNISQVPSLSPSKSSEESNVAYTGVVASLRGTPAPRFSPASPKELSRNGSIHSVGSHGSNGSNGDGFAMVDEDGKERTQCPYPECGKTFKDLKAHMLTHQNERPEKCPILNCEFHKRGFARKYDRNRHLITTHYKSTVVCGFCPGEGSSTEKSFNRIDIFKRHLVASHGVDQNSSSSRKRTVRGHLKPATSLSTEESGKCTTCGNMFSTPQALFDHLDDCILSVVTRPDASESNNERNLLQVMDDNEVQATLKRHSLPSYPASSSPSTYESSEGVDDLDGPRPAKALRTSNVGAMPIINDAPVNAIGDFDNRQQGHAGLTYSKGGVGLHVAKGRRKKKHYPQSWGCAADDMTLKKRVLCCFDGPNRLVKDDMMLGNEFNHRIQLADGGYVTDLDVETMKRAEGFHNATAEERGSYIPTNICGA